ncbi:hypothetical protein TWF281_000310 [Arthrobotrys megalospora]
MVTVHSTNETLNMGAGAIKKRLQYLHKEGQGFLKVCNIQLQHMNEHGLLDKGGQRVQKHVQKYQNVELEEKAIIAFIGESGAGKSTLLNALLDYENIVPTSGIRACTSVATEFSSRTPGMKSKFHAIIEYVSREEFEKEVDILRQDIIDEDVPLTDAEDAYSMLSSSDEENKRSVANSAAFKRRRLSDSSLVAAAAVAKDKMNALFPGFKDSDLAKITGRVKELYESESCLSEGKQVVESDDEDTFVDIIHGMIANREDDYDGEEEKKGRRLWPLIKVMKIYLNADILQSDAVLVDLPGLKDHNAARAAVAQTYMAKANEVIIVSRLTRALTDDTTAALAEMGFTKQLQFDGRKRITIVCSFCDQFRPSDARQEFRNIKTFVAEYDELLKKVKAVPSKRELMKMSPEERKRRKIEAEEASQRQTELCFKIRDEQVPALLKKRYSQLIGGKIDVKSFLVASKEYQDQTSARNFDDLEDTTDSDRTQIPQLREYCIQVPMEQKVYRTMFFINNVWRAFGAARFFVEDLGGAGLSEYKREGISKELEKAAAGMQNALSLSQCKCSEGIKGIIANVIEKTEKLAIDSRSHCGEVQKKFRKDYSHLTYRAICTRKGDMGSSQKNLNQKFLGVMDDGLAKIWSPSILDVQDILGKFIAGLGKELERFKARWESIIFDYCPHPSAEVLASKNTILQSIEAMSHGTQKLLVDQIQRLNTKQREINREFRSTSRMKKGMKTHYLEASKERGVGSYNRMVEIVSRGIQTTTAFNDIKDVISLGLRELEDTLNQENKRWCQDVGEELETNIKNWISLSDKVEQAELEEKAKLKVIISKFEKTMLSLVDEANQLEKQARI